MGDRVILALKYTPAAAPTALRKAVGGFLRYVQYRDKHPDSPAAPVKDPRVDGLLKYVAHRDRSAPAGRLFGPGGPAGDPDRRDLAAFIAMSISATRPQLDARAGVLVDRRRAVYRFVLSPERAEGLDLRRLTLSALGRLEREGAGPGLRWIAAVHRNTGHPHVHIVLAAMREDGNSYRALVINRRRLAAMKEELALEISRQREAGQRDPVQAEAVRPPEQKAPHVAESPTWRRLTPVRPTVRSHRPRPQVDFRALDRLRAAARHYRHRLERELEVEALRRERELER
ncbi:MAG: hypothetical protein E6J32_13665 [Chloroflexi bacterium]|nr:MAG: hypothetical protein E6J32_13665 [Chloroflexota bacterium]